MKFSASSFFTLLSLACLFATAPLSAQTPPARETIYNADAVDQIPTPTKRIRPDYPSSLKRRDTPAEMTLRFVVTIEGRVTDITIVKFNDADMIEPALLAYEATPFTPGMKGGKAVAVRMEQHLIFPEPKPSRKKKTEDE